ncbi:hypothetical protein ALP52_00837 [Pseudomonas amygdali pv. mori]|uniref:Uncharacterized protein n=1 Tax=Pseudomonas amygdali pv. mori TaxID=34065 RepID=A0A3M5IN90_PSEA0|nr:hypothetical protein [Pseudomonas amygdali]RMT12392.1 hypothetical protein ALP52_00837 [Pseudomonas amygdali pv. mori]
MVIDFTNKEESQSSASTNAKPAKTSKGSPEIRGLKSLTKHSEYLVEPKIDKKTKLDVHYGREWAQTNIPAAMLHPAQAEKTLSAIEMVQYRKEFAANRAAFFRDHAADGNNNRPRSKGKQMDAFRFIISCKPEELSHCKTDEEQAKFLCHLAKSVLQKFSGSSEINFYYDMVPHLKDGNPHIHIMMSSYTIDGQYYEFYRGKQDHGMIKMADDVKYELEKKHPTLLRMEHDKRLNQRMRVEVDKVTKAVTGDHAEVYTKLHAILAQHTGSDYSHPKITEQLKEAGFALRYTKAKSTAKYEDVQVHHADLGEEFRSIANLPFYDKRVLENWQTYQRFRLKDGINRDVSKVISAAVKLVNEAPSMNVVELNKTLYEQLGVMLTPTYKVDTNGRRYVGSWSFYSTSDNIKFPALKAGVLNPEHFIATSDESLSIHNEIEDLINFHKEAQRAAGKKKYEQQARKRLPKFRFLEHETLQQFISRYNSSGAYKQTLTSGIGFENALKSKWTDRKQIEIEHDGTVKVYQANASSAKAAIQALVAQGFCEMEFKGTDNPEIQRLMYIQSVLHDIKITNYTPSAALKAEAQAMLDAERDKLIEANKEKVKKHLEAVQAQPDAKPKLLYLRTNRKLDVDVDQRPKLYGFLYGVKMGMEPDAFAHIDKLTLSKAEQKKVIEHFASAENVTSVELADILRRAGITLDDDPSAEERQKAPTASTPTSQPPAPATSPESPAPVTRPATSTSPAGSSAPAKATQPVSRPPKAGSDPNRKIKP